MVKIVSYLLHAYFSMTTVSFWVHGLVNDCVGNIKKKSQISISFFVHIHVHVLEIYTQFKILQYFSFVNNNFGNHSWFFIVLIQNRYLQKHKRNNKLLQTVFHSVPISSIRRLIQTAFFHCVNKKKITKNSIMTEKDYNCSLIRYPFIHFISRASW